MPPELVSVHGTIPAYAADPACYLREEEIIKAEGA